VNLPNVTAIMPTADRGQYVPCAIEAFLAQEYEQKELLVLDNGREPVESLVPAHPSIRYERLAYPKRNTGQMRNIACSRAAGDVIVHWDDDDWSVPTRISEQVSLLLTCKVALAGYHSVLFVDEAARRAWTYTGHKRYALGTSMCYWRDEWRKHPFPELHSGEDRGFLSKASSVASVPGVDKIVARIHRGNTCSKYEKVTIAPWEEVDFSTVEAVGFPVR
jgi:glycosyltransferase involved in cell wall biosynthesis